MHNVIKFFITINYNNYEQHVNYVYTVINLQH